MMDWQLRPASSSDVEAVAELRALVLRADLHRLGRYDAQRVRQRLRDEFAPAHTQVAAPVVPWAPVLAGADEAP